MEKFTAIDIYDLYSRAVTLITEIKNLHGDVGAAADSDTAAAEALRVALDALTASIEAIEPAPTALYKAHRTVYLKGADFNA